MFAVNVRNIFTNRLGAVTIYKKSLINQITSKFLISGSTLSNNLAMPSNITSSNGKRKDLSSPDRKPGSNSKKLKISNGSSDPLRQPHASAQEAEENGIVLRKYYPHEMSNARALAYK